MTSPTSDSRQPFHGAFFWLAVAALVLIGVLRIAATWPVLNEVFDEAVHIAGGMEPLQRGTYNYERKHTPLARISVALPLYLRGIRGQNLPDMSAEGHLILYSGDYFTNLAWARSGNLSFFILCSVLLALWARRWFGSWTAIATVGLFSFLPPILGHAAVATTDMAAACGMVAAGFAFCLWLETPGLRQTCVLGFALAFALLGKVSVLPFFVLGALVIVAWARWRKLPLGIWSPLPFWTHVRNLAAGALLGALTIWAPYHFRFAALSTGHGYRPVASGLAGRLLNVALDTKIPLGEFLGGLASAATFNKFGYPAFFFGAERSTGWWYFFPVVLGIKTPLAFLILTLLGIALAVRYLRNTEWQRAMPAVFAGSTLLVCLLSNINMGVRHILPIYPLFALMAAQALVFLLENGSAKRWMRSLAAVLVLGYAWESISAHPDYLAAFNPLAGSKPERIVVGSDLDWGQDLQRLSTRLKQLNVQHLSILYSGNAVLNRFALPPYVEFGPQEHPAGWVACSVTRMMLDCAKDGNYCEWKDRTPVERIGKSIYLFNVLADGQPIPVAASPH